MTNSGCDKIVAYSDGADIHIGWTEGGHSHYIKYQSSQNQWTHYKNVTENEYGGGYDPDLTCSSNEIHYFYKDGSHDSHSRDKTKINTNWESPQYIPFDGTSIQYHKPVIANNKVNAALRVYYSSFYFSGAFISNSDRPFDQGFWNENVWLRESEIGYETESESTQDNKIHFIYYDKNDYKWEHRYISNSTLSGQIGEITLVASPSSTLIANSNDLYLLALGSIDFPSWIRLQRYDVAPAPPTGLTITKSVNNHPLLSWNANPEPDRYQYIVQKDAGELGWINLIQTSNLQYEDPNESYCTAVPPAVCPDGHWVYYRLKAVDLQSHVSDPSGNVGTYVLGGNPYKIGGEGNNEQKPDEYALSQNYPNPFNPTTTINYAIKTAGEVTLKVYDMLGTEVASLVNEIQEAGKYSVEFNASNLPSGIYFYTLTSGNFMETKKLILLK
ncbi:MAG: T9SS type A sorting domain-containing protein [bacterium]|nr:T9SS type A sorting domain-containing protein [bacterium]